MDDDLELLGSGVDPIAEQFETCVLPDKSQAANRQLQVLFLPADMRSISISRSPLLTSFT